MERLAPGFIIGRSGEPPIDADTALLTELESLLASPAEDDEPSLAHLEDTLTAGYARALALEAERMRLERRLGELASAVAAGAEERPTHGELVALGRDLSEADASLGKLRELLASVRIRASGLRAAAAAR